MVVVWAAERQRSVAEVRALLGGRVLVVMAALGVVLHRFTGLTLGRSLKVVYGRCVGK